MADRPAHTTQTEGGHGPLQKVPISVLHPCDFVHAFPSRVTVWDLSEAARQAVRDRIPAELSPDECWPWRGYVTPTGYGQFSSRLDGQPRTFQAHRSAYELFVGEIPAAFEIDHLCRNRRCVNPAHLEAVTAGENRRRAVPYFPRAAVDVTRAQELYAAGWTLAEVAEVVGVTYVTVLRRFRAAGVVTRTRGVRVACRAAGCGRGAARHGLCVTHHAAECCEAQAA